LRGDEQARPATELRWSLATRIGFRFVFSYFALYAGLEPIAFVPGANFLAVKYEELFQRVVPWVGSHILHYSVPVTPMNGSGDTTFDYAQVFTYLLIAALATLVWSVLDRKRSNYNRLHDWLRLGVRIVLGIAMLDYGASKVIPVQMPVPYLSRLLETYGDSSPMGLLWTFIGASKPYEIFCGTAEMVGGILLFIPAFASLGALVCIAVLTNVFTLNMCYDVPVKLFSFHLLLMALFLVAPDLRGLACIFVFHRAAKLSSTGPQFRRQWLNRTMLVLQLLYGIAFATLMLYGSHQRSKESAVKPPHYGVWSVEAYSADGQLRPPLLSETTRWRRIIVDFPERLTVQYVDAPQERFFLKQDTGKSFILNRRGDPNWKTELAYQEIGPDALELSGQLDGHQVRAKLRREDESKFLLTSGGFHWINEYPNNR
jgi:hypothetical protein